MRYISGFPPQYPWHNHAWHEWWRLSPEERAEPDRFFGHLIDVDRFYIFLPPWLWDEYYFRYGHSFRGDVGADKRPYKHLFDPRWAWGAMALQSLLGLWAASNVAYIELPIMRYRLLDHLVVCPRGRRLSETVEGWDVLVDAEQRLEHLRDEASGLYSQLYPPVEEPVEPAQREERWLDRERAEDFWRRLSRRWEDIYEQARHIEHQIDEITGQMAERQERVERIVLECEWRNTMVELLGEYSPSGRTVTLYPRMIGIASQRLAHQLRQPSDVVRAKLHTIVEMHEFAHAITHVGVDANGAGWHDPSSAPSELHELLAQAITYHLIRRIGDGGLLDVFREFNEQQPPAYKLWQVFEHEETEVLREFLLLKRRNAIQTDVISEAQATLAQLRTQISRSPQKRQSLRRDAGLISELRHRLQSVKSATSPLELALASRDLLQLCVEREPLRSWLQAGAYSADSRQLTLITANAVSSVSGVSVVRSTTPDADDITKLEKTALSPTEESARDQIVAIAEKLVQ